MDLETALRALRNLPETAAGMHYWVDSLCIDQSNIVEKTHEVKRMGEIYKSARAVVVWLGPEREGDEQVFRATQHLTRYLNEYRFPKLILPKKYAYQNLNAITKFMKKPYWHGMWIIQELVLNHSSTLFMCGRLRFSRHMIRIAAQYFR